VVGITLREVIHAAPLPEEAVLGVMEQICGALGEVHRMGLSHGDIKPANLMMATEPKPIVKLLDFGLVRDSAGLLRRMERTRKLPTDAFAKELDAGRLMGTPQYLAPEAILDAYLAQDAAALRDPASDVFALGVILSELLTGRAPWPFVPDAWSRNEYIRQTAAYVALRGRVDGLQLARPPNVARELWCIVRSCLASDRNLRYDHAVHIRDALRGYGRRNSLLPRPLFRDRARLVADRITSQIRKRRSRT
jgi:serine/threonine protein kinase